MRRSIIHTVTLALLSFAGGGCYLSHERMGPSPLDGGSRDGGRPDSGNADAGTDAGPPIPCRSSCTGERVIARGTPLQVEALLDVAMNGPTLGVLVREYHDEGGEGRPLYSLVLIDAASGTISRADPAPAAQTATGLVGAGLRVIGGNWVAVVVRTDDVVTARPATAFFGAVAWTAAGRVAWIVPRIATVPSTVRPCDCVQRAVAFGRDERIVAALGVGADLWAVDLRIGSSPPGPAEALRLASLAPGAVSAPPLAGGVLNSGTIAIVGGGFAAGVDPRTPFRIAGIVEDAPLPFATLSTAGYAPPPLVAVRRDGATATLLHVAPRTPGALEDVVHAVAIDGRGGTIDDLALTLSDGLLPLAMASFGDDRGTGLVWATRSGELRVLATAHVDGTGSRWRDCGHDIDTPVVATAGGGLFGAGVYGGTAMLASAAASAVRVVLLETDGSLAVLELTSCEIIERR